MPFITHLRTVFFCMASELRTALRGAHTAAYLFFPLALYPLMLWATTQVMLYEEGRQENEVLRVVTEGPPELAGALSADPFVSVEGDLEALRKGEVDLVAKARTQGELWSVDLYHHSTRPRSVRALDEAEDTLSDLRDSRLIALAEAAQIDAAILEPYTVDRQALNPAERELAGVFAAALGYIATMMMLLGSIYPSVHMLVGEREAGTLETLLLAATPRWTLLLGKVFAGALLAAVVALGNLMALALTVVHIATLVSGETVPFSIPWLALFGVLPSLFASAMLSSALMLLAMVPARSFKEGEMLGTWVLTLLMLPGIYAMLGLISGEPGVLWPLPFANMVEVLHAAATDDLTVAHALGVALYDLTLAMVVVATLGMLVDREDYLVGGHLPSWLSWLHRSEVA